MLKILQARLQQYTDREFPDVQAGFRKDRGTRDQIANIHWIIKKAWEFQKNICFIDYAKAFDCVDHNRLWKILEEVGIQDHLTCLLRNLFAGQEVTELDNIQPWCTPFLIWNQSVVPCPVLTVASWPAYRCLKRQVRWSDIPISSRIFQSLLWSTQSKALA